MRRVRNELLSLATVLTVPAAIISIFPFSAIGFKAQPGKSSPTASVAFVTLSKATEESVLRAAKSSWQGDANGVRHLHAELSFGELPKIPDRPVLDLDGRTRQPGIAPVSLEATCYLPSQSASAPIKLQSENAADGALPFPKKDLLKIE